MPKSPVSSSRKKSVSRHCGFGACITIKKHDGMVVLTSTVTGTVLVATEQEWDAFAATLARDPRGK